MRAAVYARVSTEEQAKHGYSLDEQIQACHARAIELGATEVLVFRDEAISGATLDRPELNKLRDLIAQGEINLLVMRDPDRFSRKLSYQLILTEEFEKAGVQLEFLDFTWQDTPEGRMFYSIKGAISEYEREKISERMTRGRLQKAKQGLIPMNFSLYGYDYSPETGIVSINEREAEVVRYIFDRFLSYESPAAITNELNRLGIPTKKNTGFWFRQTVRQLLMNRAYMGEWVYRKNSDNPIIIPVPAIVSKEVWEKAQAILAESRRLWCSYGKEKYLLSGIVTCSDCGTPMGGARLKYWGRIVRGYTCRKSPSTNRIPGCYPTKIVNADALENIVWENIVDLYSNPDRLFMEISGQLPSNDSLKKEIAKLEKQLQDTERGRSQLVDIISSGLVELDNNTKQKLGKLKQRKESLERRLNELKKDLRKIEFTKKDMQLIYQMSQQFIEQVDNLSFEAKQKLVRTTISQVIVSGRVQGTYHKPNELPGTQIVININEHLLDSLKVLTNVGR